MTDFCEAVIGANSVLGTEDDRRSLAIGLFARVLPSRPGRRPTPVPRKVSRPTTVWAVLRGHESACGVECPLHVAAVSGLAVVEAGGTWPDLFNQGIECETAPGVQHTRVTPRSPAAHNAAVALRYLDQWMQQPTGSYLMADAVREAAKAETKVHGLDGAVAFCLALADKFGLNSFDRHGGSKKEG
jgi:hypothetical protein